jgi:hypothetical protein
MFCWCLIVSESGRASAGSELVCGADTTATFPLGQTYVSFTLVAEGPKVTVTAADPTGIMGTVSVIIAIVIIIIINSSSSRMMLDRGVSLACGRRAGRGCREVERVVGGGVVMMIMMMMMTTTKMMIEDHHPVKLTASCASFQVVAVYDAAGALVGSGPSTVSVRANLLQNEQRLRANLLLKEQRCGAISTNFQHPDCAVVAWSLVAQTLRRISTMQQSCNAPRSHPISHLPIDKRTQSGDRWSWRRWGDADGGGIQIQVIIMYHFVYRTKSLPGQLTNTCNRVTGGRGAGVDADGGDRIQNRVINCADIACIQHPVIPHGDLSTDKDMQSGDRWTWPRGRR